MTQPRRRTRPQGVLAFGDSITNAGGELQWGVPLQSWALWTARGLGVPYTPYAVDGARASDVTQKQIPLFEQVNFYKDARYHLGCLYIGTNDVVFPGFHPDVFEREFYTALEFLAQRCDRLICPNLPVTVGRPPNAHGIAHVNATVAAAAEKHGALLLDLRDFRARNWIMPDHIHPTAFGQVAIAERALDLLAADGMEVHIRPSTLIFPDWQNRLGRLRGDVNYVKRAARERLFQTVRQLRG